MAARKTKQVKRVVEAPRFFIVNPAGAIHEVTEEHAQSRLFQPGWRSATLDEVKELMARGGEQRFDDPICEPWRPVPVALEGLEGLAASALEEPEAVEEGEV